LSLAVTVTAAGTPLKHWKLAVVAGHPLSTGAWVSFTVTLKPQAAVWPLVSVAVQVTLVVPLAKVEPDAGLQATVTPGQLSLAVGVAKFTTALH